MKICGSCGSQMPDEALVCGNCGTPLQASQIPQEQDSQQQDFPQQSYQQQDFPQQPYQQQDFPQQPYQPMGYQQPINMNPNAKNKAIAALACGIVGLVFSFFGWASSGITAVLGLILCIVGIVLAVKARNEMPVGVPGRGMATGGLVCAIIGAVLSGIIALCTLCVLACAACASAGAASYSYNNFDWYTILFM